MIRINNLPVPLDFDFSGLKELCCKKLKLSEKQIKSIKLAKKSVDARKKQNIRFIISVELEAEKEEKLLHTIKGAVPVKKEKYTIEHVASPKHRPVVVGFGPAGMFASLILAMSGARPIVLERGADVDTRCRKVDIFTSTGELDCECNVQFGEGGAGTFSDGKLTTGINDRRISWILRKLVEFGAPEEITYLAKPHIGTDKLRNVVKRLREQVIELGGEVRFGARFCGYNEKNGCISSVLYEQSGETYTIDTDSVILATGHSARDTFEMLYEKNISISQKNFAVGVRIEHLRRDIDKAMYGEFAGHHALKAADYKLAVHLPSGRTAYTFCMCPGGYVVAASSEKGRLAVNGMSCFNRNSENSNSALLVNVDSGDYGSDHPLAGMYFQRKIEEEAFSAGGGGYNAPITLVGDFLEGRCSVKIGSVKPSYKPGVKFARPEEYLPEFVCSSLKLGIKKMGRLIKGFDDPEAVLTGLESRSSSPVRINRGEDLQSVTLRGLYPCGEGAGFAGGIMSAAVDGMKCAEAIIRNMTEND